MPNPHFRVQVISRQGGRSAVAAAAYRSGEVLTASPSVVGMAAYRAGEYLGTDAGETFDYTRKEGVVWSNIYTPDRAPNWAMDREQLWNRAELAEGRKDARLAREIEASLPRELGEERWQAMCGELAERFTRHGLVVDVSIHNVKARDGGAQPHAHFLIADRPVDDQGFRHSKTDVRFLNSKQALNEWRDTWEGITNRHLEAEGREERLSLQSYAARGIEREPTRTLGPKASVQEKQGVRTPEGDYNRRVMAENALREERQRLERDESDGGRVPVWSDWRGVSAELDAKRDAVHRFRFKDADHEKGEAVSEAQDRRAETLYHRQQEDPPPESTAPATPPEETREQSAIAASLSEAQRADVLNAGATLNRPEVELRGEVREAETGELARPLSPATWQERANERYQGRNLDDDGDTPRAPYATPPASPVASAPEDTRENSAVAASLNSADRASVEQIRAANTNVQHTRETMTPGQDRDTGQQGLTPPWQQEQSSQVDNFFDRHGGKADDKRQDTDQAVDKEQERNQKRELERG